MSNRRQWEETIRDHDVLLVEDDADIREMTSTVLRKAGARVHTAGDCEEAALRLAERGFDAILLDWNLAGSTGGGLLVTLRADYPELFARSAVVTGDLLSIPGQHEAESYGRPVLAKPFRPARLLELLAGLLDGPSDEA